MSSPDSHEPQQSGGTGVARMLLFLSALVIGTGSLGTVKLARDARLEFLPFLLMIGLPLAAAVMAATFARDSIEKERPSWAAGVTLPVMHAAILLGLATLVRTRYTDIEAPAELQTASMWADWRMALLSLTVQIVVCSFLVAMLRARSRRSAS